MVCSRIRAINTGRIENEFKVESYPSIVASLMKLTHMMAGLVQHSDADVRKSTVFCLVEVHNIVGDENFFQFSELLNPR